MTYDKKANQFDKWLKKLDNIFMEHFGLGYLDFPDFDWYNLFEDEVSPEEAFEEYCEEHDVQYLVNLG